MRARWTAPHSTGVNGWKWADLSAREPRKHLLDCMLQTPWRLRPSLELVPRPTPQSNTPDDQRLPALRTQIGHRLRQARRAAGRSQEEVAEISGVSRTHVVDIESGRRSLQYDRLFDLAAATATTVEALTHGIETTPPGQPRP